LRSADDADDLTQLITTNKSTMARISALELAVQELTNLIRRPDHKTNAFSSMRSWTIRKQATAGGPIRKDGQISV
jgi:hypothetical protein